MKQQEEHGAEEEKEGVLHEETFHRNPSIKIPEQRSRLQLAESTASHIWHRLPLLQVRPAFAWNICKQHLSGTGRYLSLLRLRLRLSATHAFVHGRDMVELQADWDSHISTGCQLLLQTLFTRVTQEGHVMESDNVKACMHACRSWRWLSCGSYSWPLSSLSPATTTAPGNTLSSSSLKSSSCSE